ncbi:hypothetical protein [Streptomyces sp. NRRL F-3307]|uniref:wHTH domain-containing protein n=1 Tax=Streptomyces TaxID=1883 RepID=UPI003B63E0A0
MPRTPPGRPELGHGRGLPEGGSGGRRLLPGFRRHQVLGWSFAEVVDRLERLGLQAPATSVSHLAPDDLRIVSEQVTGDAPWPDPGEPVHPVHVLDAANQTGHTVDHVVDRLTEFGYRMAMRPVPPQQPGALRLLSDTCDAQGPSLDPGTSTPPTSCGPPPSPGTGPTTSSPVSRTSGSASPPACRNRNRSARGSRAGTWTVKNPGRPVDPAHVLRAADALNRSPRAVVARLEELGHRLSDGVALSPGAGPAEQG